MPRWAKPSEEEPQCFVGDRVLIIVLARRHFHDIQLSPMLAVLERTESGWHDLTDGGYSLEDAEFWASEASVVAFASP